MQLNGGLSGFFLLFFHNKKGLIIVKLSIVNLHN